MSRDNKGTAEFFSKEFAIAVTADDVRRCKQRPKQKSERKAPTPAYGYAIAEYAAMTDDDWMATALPEKTKRGRKTKGKKNSFQLAKIRNKSRSYRLRQKNSKLAPIHRQSPRRQKEETPPEEVKGV